MCEHASALHSAICQHSNATWHLVLLDLHQAWSHARGVYQYADHGMSKAWFHLVSLLREHLNTQVCVVL